MSEFDFHTVEVAVARLKINYAGFNFLLFCESSQTGLRGIIDIGLHSRAKGYSRHTFVVPIEGLHPSDSEAYYRYFRDALIQLNRLPALINTTVGAR